MLKPMFKYPGGKSKELKVINGLLPDKFDKIYEPFVGGGAFFLSRDNPAVVNDNNQLVINFYEVVKNETLFNQLLDKYEQHKNFVNLDNLSKEELRNTAGNLCNLYYTCRDTINKQFTTPDVDVAFAFLCVRQLAFSGMHRQDSKGKFNVPFGWYKKFSANVKQQHHERFKNVEICFGSFEGSLTNATSNDFIFLDPPYLNRAGYKDETGSKGTELHTKLFNILNSTSAKWLLVHTDIPFYRELYKDYNLFSADHLYAQRFGKNKDHSSSSTKHLYITNY